MSIAQDFKQHFRLLPSAWLLVVQLFILILSFFTYDHGAYRVLTWILGVLALLLIGRVIRETSVFTLTGLFFVLGALFFSVLILLGFNQVSIQILTYGFEACAYFYAAYGLLRYMFADRYLTKDELFAAGAVFTLIAWGFAFLYNICQLLVPMSFSKPDHQGLQSWLDLLFLSFSLQSATGLSDIFPISPAARVISILQMFMGVMFLAVVVSRLVALQYISHLPEKNHHDDT